MAVSQLRRQIPDPLAVPTATGIIADGALTIDSNDADSLNTLVFDTAADPSNAPTTAPQLVPSRTPTITIPSTPTSSSEPSNVDASSSTSHPTIAMSTVIGSCVGAFVGAVALICLGFWFYRRYSRSLKYKSRGPLNTRGDVQRRRSHREPWNKIEDGNAVKWDSSNNAPTEESVAPMEKLTMFKKTPSTRTAYTHHDEPVHFELNHPYAAQFSSAIANHGQDISSQNMVTVTDDNAPSLPRPFMGRDGHDSGPLPWDSTANSSFLSVRIPSERLSGAMSPSLTMAIPTPPATASPLHRWESAEIINLHGQSAEIVNPFRDEYAEKNRSSNPFFGAHDEHPRRSRSNSIRGRSNSTASSVYIPVPRLDKGKGRAINPFDDDEYPPPVPTITTTRQETEQQLTAPRPAFATHAHSSSSSSDSSSRALASLLAALDGDATEEDVQSRLRIASMQPSINSMLSVYRDNDVDVTKDFPLPPGSPGHSTANSFVTAHSDKTHRA